MMPIDCFLFGGVCAGLKQSKKLDLGLIFCSQPCVVGGIFTQNRYPSPHVLYGREILPSKNIQAILVNSGQSLAGMGKQGIRTNKDILKIASKNLKISTNQILTSSTGVIGEAPNIQKIEKALPSLKNTLSSNPQKFADAIMTTDLKSKISTKSFSILGKKYSIVGIAKGSGMIAPNMATMLAYITTDFPFALSEIQKVTQKVGSQSFNCVTVDGDTSTSDSFYLLSAHSQKLNSQKSQSVSKQAKEEATQHILEIAQDLSKKIAADGEGAKHLIELKIKRASNPKVARSILQKVLNSPLIKCCIHGEDPNWGRFIMALGNALAENGLANFTPANIKIQNCLIFKKDAPVKFDEKELKKKMKQFEVKLEIDMLVGKSELTGWGCDLSKEYVSINADYTT